MIDYKIVGSGSSGNAVRIEDVMIDCGMSFKKMKPELEKCRYLLLTHTHSDHIKPSIYNQIRKYYPEIVTIGNYEIAQRYNIDLICNSGFPCEIGCYRFVPFECDHDVLAYGYTWNTNGNSIIYCTDTENFDDAPNLKYDYFFIEANYDEHKTDQMRRIHRGNYYAYLSSTSRHASRQQAKAFFYCHRRDKEAELIELHKSERFY